MVDAAAMPIAVCTAITALDAAGIGRGSRVLVHAAAGAVGSMFIQLAKVRGASVVAITAAKNIDYIRSLGADQVLDRGGDWQAQVEPVDAVFDGFGPAAQDLSWKLIKAGGILVSLVQPPSESEAAAHGVRGTMIFGRPDGASLAEVDALVAAGTVRMKIASVLPIGQVREALAASQSGGTVGKIVITFA